MANKSPFIIPIVPKLIRKDEAWVLEITSQDKLIIPHAIANKIAAQINGAGWNDAMEHVASWIESITTRSNGPLSELPRLIRGMKK